MRARNLGASHRSATGQQQRSWIPAGAAGAAALLWAAWLSGQQRLKAQQPNNTLLLLEAASEAAAARQPAGPACTPACSAGSCRGPTSQDPKPDDANPGLASPQIPLGAGLGLYHQLKKDGNIAIVCYGDGAANQGQVHEVRSMEPCVRGLSMPNRPLTLPPRAPEQQAGR